MSVVCIGIDLVTVSRFRALYCGEDSEALSDMFAACELKDAGTGADQWERLAARHAAKEAVLKALEKSRADVALTDIVVRLRDTGAPYLQLNGVAADRARALGVADWLVSLTHTDDVAGAVVVGSTRLNGT